MSSDFLTTKNHLLRLLQGLNYKKYATDNVKEKTLKHISFYLEKLSKLNLKEALKEKKLREEQEIIDKMERDLRTIENERKREIEISLEKTRQRKEEFERIENETKRRLEENKDMRNEEINHIILNQSKRRRRLLKKFIKTTKNRPSRKIANKLKGICPDPNFCLAFGIHVDVINNFFEFFKSLKYVRKSEPISIDYAGNNFSGNGKVLLLKYEREAYNSYAVIKTPLKYDSDSIIYEYLVGRYFINYYYKKFPCFVQTYGFCIIDDKRYLRQNKVLNLMPLEEVSQIEDRENKSKLFSISGIDSILTETCKNPTQFSLIIENIYKPFKINDKLKNPLTDETINFIREELLLILFQIYYALEELKDIFTHYDLSYRNVLIYEPVPGKYIEYHYHCRGKVIRFKSKYIVKIIDYGRCYFNNSLFNSSDIYRLVCNIAECNRKISSEDDNRCGKKLGFNMFDEPDVFKGIMINSSSVNKSHDLLLLADIRERIFKLRGMRMDYFIDLFSTTGTIARNRQNGESVLFLFEQLKYDLIHGTRPIPNSGLIKLELNSSTSSKTMSSTIKSHNKCVTIPSEINPSEKIKIVGKINNVSDAFEILFYLIAMIPHNEYADLTKIGDLEIFGKDINMKFTETHPSMGVKLPGHIPREPSMGTMASMGVKLPGHIPRGGKKSRKIM